MRGRGGNLSGWCGSSLGARQEGRGSRAIEGGADRDLVSLQSAHSWRGLRGTTLACARGPQQWPKVLAVQRRLELIIDLEEQKMKDMRDFVISSEACDSLLPCSALGESHHE